MLSGRVLSDSQVEQVRSASETILEQTGIRVQDTQMVRLCAQAGARVEEPSGLVRWPKSLLRELLGRAPDRFTVKGVDGSAREVGGDRQWGFAITSDPWVIDYDTQQPRRPRTEDIRRNTIIAQQLDLVGNMSCMDFPVSDFPGPHANLRALEVHLLHHAKHNFVLPTSVESLQRWLKIGRILNRGADLRGSRLFSVGVPTLTPLAITGMNVELLRLACDHDLPVVPTVCPTSGMTSPYTLAGTLALAHAEVLALLALTQLHRPGHPFLYAMGTAAANMQNGACLYYTLDKVLLKLAHVQVAKTYHLPVTAECGGTMVHRFDPQSGAEGMLFMLAAVASGANMLAGFGSTYNAVGHSTEMMVIQEAYFRAAQFLRRGIRTDAERLAVETINQVGPGGEYLTDDLTMQNLRGDEFFDHELFDHSGESTRSRSLLERAHDKVETLVAGYRSPVPGDIQENLRKFFREEMR